MMIEQIALGVGIIVGVATLIRYGLQLKTWWVKNVRRTKNYD